MFAFNFSILLPTCGHDILQICFVFFLDFFDLSNFAIDEDKFLRFYVSFLSYKNAVQKKIIFTLEEFSA